MNQQEQMNVLINSLPEDVKKALPADLTAELLLRLHIDAGKRMMAAADKQTKTMCTNLRAKLEGKTVIPSKPKGIGKFCVEKIKEGLSNEDILKLVAETFEGVSTSVKCIRWYRCKVNNNFM